MAASNLFVNRVDQYRVALCRGSALYDHVLKPGLAHSLEERFAHSDDVIAVANLFVSYTRPPDESRDTERKFRSRGGKQRWTTALRFLSAVDIHKDVALAERRGFTHAWLYDTQMICADVFQCLALCAAKTKK